MVGRIVKGFAGLLVLAAISIGLGYWYADSTINRDRSLPKVLGMPHTGTLTPSMEPFAGPHPRLKSRPAETFEFPISSGETGPVRPLYAGEPQYPFLCRTTESDLGHPIVDNHDEIGMAVPNENGETGGYSKDCGLPTRIYYWYYSNEQQRFRPVQGTVPADVRMLELDEGPVPYVVRVEVGTINRFIYVLAFLAGAEDRPETADIGRWNGRLIYLFRGGVGIGRRQGRTNVEAVLRRHEAELAKGYAVANSSGNQTTNTYNIWLAEDTAARVKQQFVSQYGEPEYTVGFGGSGGAIQQYLIGQNRPGLLDAAIAVFSYPDMVSQSIHVLDCELLQYYFDVQDRDNARWASLRARSAIEGFHYNNSLTPKMATFSRLAELARGNWPDFGRGSTECTRSWRGLSPLVLNPYYAHFVNRFAEGVRDQVEWTFWADLAPWFGTDSQGFARRTWDNVGVEYGLEALREGDLSVDEFLDLNRRIGGWKPTRTMRPPRYWLFDSATSGLAEFSPWDHHNMTHDDGADTAPRSEGDLGAIQAAYRSGQVFLGAIDIPILDVRQYLEPELDMHHFSAAFSSRLRIIDALGDAGHQILWTNRPPDHLFEQAFDAIDRWIRNIQTHPDRSLVENRPADVVHRCWDGAGATIAEGETVWDGTWNDRPDGACMQRFPIYGTSRTRAGDDLRGTRFRCARIPVEEALSNGHYDPVDLTDHRAALSEIFPDGVCDYARPDPALPPGLVTQLVETIDAARIPSVISRRELQ